MKDGVDFFKVDIFGAIVGATFSRCGKYRYQLYNIWNSNGPRVMFIGLNPSTATHAKPDNTIHKVTKIAKVNGFGGFYMLNVFAWITPHPEELLVCEDPIRHNGDYLDYYGKRADEIVFCWGAFKEAKDEAKRVVEKFPSAKALFINKDGSPKHPLYCKDESKLIPFHKT